MHGCWSRHASLILVLVSARIADPLAGLGKQMFNCDNMVFIKLKQGLICDNIVLKNKLDKVVGETKTLRQSLDEIGSRVKEINDVCDILVSEKLNHAGNSCVKNNHSRNSTTKVQKVFV